MRVATLGDGTPEVAVVGAIHGDEPCGRDAIEGLLADPPEVQRPVKLVVANERALDAGERYLDADLNRSFPGDPDADAHEERLAAALADEVEDCETLALHSTQSYREMFALVDEVTPYVERVCPHLTVDAVVRTHGANDGRVFSAVGRVIEVECGYQGSEAAARNAERVVREFLAATGAVDRPVPAETELPVYQLGDPIPKAAADEYEVYADNFERVLEGEPVAAADGEPVVAERTFHPVLLSPEGYEDVFGYTADHVGVLD